MSGEYSKAHQLEPGVPKAPPSRTEMALQRAYNLALQADDEVRRADVLVANHDMSEEKEELMALSKAMLEQAAKNIAQLLMLGMLDDGAD